MAWDIYIQDLPDVPTVADIPADFRPRPIGRFDDRLKEILEEVPFAERQDDDWLFVRTAAIDLSLVLTREAGTDLLSHILVHVHDGEISPACVAGILRRMGLRALDTSTGGFFDLNDPERSPGAWKAYREQVLHGR